MLGLDKLPRRSLFHLLAMQGMILADRGRLCRPGIALLMLLPWMFNSEFLEGGIDWWWAIRPP